MEGLRQFTDDSFKPRVSLGEKPDEQAVCRLQKFLLLFCRFSAITVTQKNSNNIHWHAVIELIEI